VYGGSVSAATFLACGRKALSGSSDGTLQLWDLEGGAELRRFKGSGGEVQALAVLADNRRALSSSHDGMERAPWLAAYVAELTAFPNAMHDDQVDSTAQMLDWFKSAAREPGFLGYYRMLAQRLDAAEPG
jgi:WD40 repeat protein